MVLRGSGLKLLILSLNPSAKLLHLVVLGRRESPDRMQDISTLICLHGWSSHLFKKAHELVNITHI
jgi:hypothetical protein